MANNIAVSVTADVGGLVAGMAVAKEAAKDYGKEMRALARAVKDGDTSQETKARLFEVSEAYAKATATAALYDREIRKVQTSNAAANDNAGQLRAGMQNLGFQLQDVAVQFASGQRAGTIFAQQLPQISGAITQIAQAGGNASGMLGRFATFMSGPWGVAVGVGAAVLSPLIARLFDTGAAADDATARLQTTAQAARNLIGAENALALAEKEIELNKLRDRRLELENYIDRQPKNPATGQPMFSYAQQKELLAVNQQILAQKAIVDSANEQNQKLLNNLDKATRPIIGGSRGGGSGARQAGQDAGREYRSGLDQELRALQKTTDKLEATVFKPLAARTAEMFQGRDDRADKELKARLSFIKRANAAELAETQRFEEQKRAIQERTVAPFAQSIARMLTLQRGFIGTVRDLWGSLTGIVEQAVARMVQSFLIGLLTQEVASEATNRKLVAADASAAASGAYKAVVGIPIIGPILAPIAAATAYAGVMAFSAEDGWDVPGGGGAGIDGRGGRPAIIHPREMVLPAQIADAVRALPNGIAGATTATASLRGASATVGSFSDGAFSSPRISGGVGSAQGRGSRSAGASAGMTINISAVDAQGVKRLFMDRKSDLAEALRKYARNGGR